MIEDFEKDILTPVDSDQTMKELLRMTIQSPVDRLAKWTVDYNSHNEELSRRKSSIISGVYPHVDQRQVWRSEGLERLPSESKAFKN